MTLRHYEPVAADCPGFSPGGASLPTSLRMWTVPNAWLLWSAKDGGPVVITTSPVAATARDTLPAGARVFEMEVWEPKDHDPSCGCSCCRAAQEVLLKMLAHSCRVEPDELLELKRQFDVGTWLNLLAQRYERRA